MLYSHHKLSHTRRSRNSCNVSVMHSDTTKGKLYASKVSFYVTNILEHVQYVDFRKAYKMCGILFDAYVARNRNARGQIFGFVFHSCEAG